MEVSLSTKNDHIDRSLQSSSIFGYESYRRDHSDRGRGLNIKILECVSRQDKEIEQVTDVIEYGVALMFVYFIEWTCNMDRCGWVV